MVHTLDDEKFAGVSNLNLYIISQEPDVYTEQVTGDNKASLYT